MTYTKLTIAKKLLQRYFWVGPLGNSVCTLQVGDLPVQKIPVRVSVGGTPLVMQPGRLLLPGYSPQKPHGTLKQPQGWPALPQGSSTQPWLTSAQSQGSSLQPSRILQLTRSPAGAESVMAEMQQESKTEMAMDFGQLLAESKAQHSFHVFNTSSMAVQLDWTFYRCELAASLHISETAVVGAL